MIARIAGRGYSFKGAGLYYLHDKEAMTTDRVEWTQTRNMAIQDPDAAMNYMAYTAINANKLKQEAGVKMTGRKRERGTVYTFSLSWSPEENPDKETMVRSADETLEVLGLQDHQSVIVAHNDTDHSHIHMIVNLVNPTNGKMHDPDWGSKLKMSDWSLKHEFENGKVFCEQRVKNHEDRQKGKQTRYQEPRHQLKEQIQEIYSQSDNGQSFSAALQENGFTLATGNRRRFVLVDDYGKIHSLSRQLDKDQRKEHLQKLTDIKHQNLPVAQTIAEERKYFDRDKYETEQQQKIEDAAIEQERKKLEEEKKVEQQKQKSKSVNQEQPTQIENPNEQTLKEQEPALINPFYKRFDRLSAWEGDAHRKRQKLKEVLSKTYNRDELAKTIDNLEEQIGANDNFKGRISGRLQKLQDELEAKRLTLADTDKRIEEQTGKLEKEIAETKPADYWDSGEKKKPEQENTIDLEAEKISRTKQKIWEEMQRGNKNQDRNKGYDLEH